ncbi:MAG: phosphoserine phosphatase SerB [Rhodospirillales bacterium]|nr:phosphoserine phosphatase SerB [Rhodospirillales bacterium]MBO6787158.1 phosphoserine phosphatase SerB [Rhodospirillales bacterium]
MQSVLTLIAPEAAPLPERIVGEVRAALNTLGAETGYPVWLCDGIAADIAFEMLADDQAQAVARDITGDAPIDIIAQEAATRRKALLLADMDSTIVTSETLDDLAAHIGIKDEIAAITARAMNGELDFKEALRERVGRLKGLAADALADAYAEVELSKGAETLVRTMAAGGAHCVLVSGGFKYFTSRIRERCGFHEDLSNDFVIEDGKLTGEVTEPILDKDVKLQTLIARAAEHGLSLAHTLSVGDGANDLPMLKAAGLGVAYRGKPAVRAEAPAQLDHADLTGLLYAQGYRVEEFVR